MAETAGFTGNRHRSPEELDAWLHGHKEAPVEPDLPIVDAHHHLWPEPSHRFGLREMVESAAGLNLIGSVFVECGAAYSMEMRYGADCDDHAPAHALTVEETRFVMDAIEGDAEARRLGLCGGIVGFVDLQLGRSRATALLEQHKDAGRGRFRGIRQSAAWDPAMARTSWRLPPPGFLLDEKFQSGFAALGPLDLSFDAWIYYPQMLDLILLARCHPDVPIILNHFGGIVGIGFYAGFLNAGLARWRHYVQELACYPNVVMKMGGLGIPAAGFGFHLRDEPPGSDVLAAAWKPYIDGAVEAFGADRCMIGSNFPVDRQSAEYTTLWNAYKIATSDYSKAERTAIFSGTAMRVYRFDPPSTQTGMVSRAAVPTQGA